jgi:hypothetical protein
MPEEFRANIHLGGTCHKSNHRRKTYCDKSKSHGFKVARLILFVQQGPCWKVTLSGLEGMKVLPIKDIEAK